MTSARDDEAGLALSITLELSPQGVLRTRARLTDLFTGRGVTEMPYTLDGLTLSLPVPRRAAELLDFAGRHLRERAPQRRPFDIGARVRDNRRGRTGADATTLLVAGTEGFDFGVGRGLGPAHGLERQPPVGGRADARTGTRCWPAANCCCRARSCWPQAVPTSRRGSTGATRSAWTRCRGRFHELLRARPGHPTSPRPIILNTWESVYFDLNLDRLIALAEHAAEVGAERYVLDDGWFVGRRSDNAGLGDWQVDPDVWPLGLHPLVDRVTELGMQFGLWVEPEMVNPDSNLAREHPDWIMATGGRMPILSRQQQVLDLGKPAAFDYILDSLDALLTEYESAT